MTTDALISPADVQQVKEGMVTRKWQEVIYWMLEREPELVLVFCDRLDKITAILDRAVSDPRLRQHLVWQMYKLLCEPMVLLNRSHRRLWEDFLPGAAGDAKR